MRIHLPTTGDPVNDNFSPQPPYATNPTPFPRPDHKAKKHGRPKPKRHVRRTDRRLAALALVGDGE